MLVSHWLLYSYLSLIGPYYCLSLADLIQDGLPPICFTLVFIIWSILCWSLKFLTACIFLIPTWGIVDATFNAECFCVQWDRESGFFGHVHTLMPSDTFLKLCQCLNCLFFHLNVNSAFFLHDFLLSSSRILPKKICIYTILSLIIS